MMKRQHQTSPHESRRGGAVIIVVMSLLTMLVFMGLFFYNWTNQERNNAEHFADATDRAEFDPAPVMDFGLKQVLVSTEENLANSALYGNRWSLAAHVVGPLTGDGRPMMAHPYSGRGITIATDPNDPTLFQLDYTGDGDADFDQSNFILNLSPLANGGTAHVLVQNPQFNPAAGYTYPDINSLFLAMDYVDPISGRRIVKPSFALPGYFPALRQSGFAPWYMAAQTRNQVLRPHQTLVYPNDGSPRYVSGTVQAQSGDRNRVIGPFPFAVGALGAWDNSGNLYTFDMDLSGDGVPDSIAMDLDHPLIDLPGGRQVVPIFYFKIIDQDPLLNTNVHGHMPEFTLQSRANAANLLEDVFLRETFVHYSNLGLTPAEINLQFALLANPQSGDFLSQTPQMRAWATLPHRGMLADHTQMPPDVTNVPAPEQFDRLSMANMELAMLLLGRPEFDPETLRVQGSQDWEGRYGRDDEATGVSQLRAGLGMLANAGIPPGKFPAPGRVDVDDDRDANVNLDGNPNLRRRTGGMFRAIQFLSDLWTPVTSNPSGPLGQPLFVPSFVHPLDFVGLGNSLNVNPAGLNIGSTVMRENSPQFQLNPFPANPMGHILGERVPGNLEGTIEPPTEMSNPLRWPQYPLNGSWQNQGSLLMDGVPFRTYRDAANSALQPNSIVDFLVDEADEMIVNWNIPDRRDAPFLPSEIAGLHLSERDWREARMSSRLRHLMPFNFENNRQAPAIRSQFTTESWDRMQFAFGPVASGVFRQWEFNDGSTNRFPPRFAGSGASRHENTHFSDPSTYDVSVAPFDPFRPEVRRLLTTRITGSGNTNPLFPQRRLNLNRILSDDVLAIQNAPVAVDPQDVAAFDDAGNPRFRDLVPHPIINLADDSVPEMIHVNLTFATAQALGPGHPYNRFAEIATDPAVQEWWARYDRQRLARDIYVLLYTLSGYDPGVGGPDETDVTQFPVDPLMAREMAQFAVNYVDALDRDNVITKFEYDPDLRNGWNPSEVVYGVEAQQLVFSEALLFETVEVDGDNENTLHNEDDTAIRFLYLELRNVSPFPVELDNETWRIVRVRAAEEGDGDGEDIAEVAVTLHANPNGDVMTIGPGENFLIGCHHHDMDNPLEGQSPVVNGAGEPIGSEFYVRRADGEQLECVIPRGSNQTVESNQVRPQGNQLLLDLDLTPHIDGNPNNHSRYRTFEPIDGTDYTGTTLVEPGGEGASTAITLVLQRRRNLHAGGGGEMEWIEVDRLRDIPVQTLSIGSGDGPEEIITALESLSSVERRHPLNRAERTHPNTGEAPFHSMSVDNTRHQANAAWREDMADLTGNPNEPYSAWQPHFDRDFSSAMELLSVPIYGPKSDLIEEEFNLIRHGSVVGNLVQNLGNNRWRLTGHRTAQTRFLLPGGGVGIPPNHSWNEVAGEILPNRWYRLFNFVEVPPRNQDVIAERLRWHRRTPGRMNLNTLRHEHVFAGLIDDSVHHNYTSPGYNDSRPTRNTINNDRWWMRQFVRSRDRDDMQPDPSLPRLPGTPQSRPFRPLGYIDTVNPEQSIQNTILRFGEGAVPGTSDSPHLNRVGLFEARPTIDFNENTDNDRVDYHTRHRILAKVANNSTTRSHVFAIWAGFTLHEAHRLPNGNVQIGARAEDLPVFRKFLVVDMSRLEEALDTSGPQPRFDFRKFIIHQQRLP
jgi:hypothetical protein